MGHEDFTTYAEVDSGSDITITSSKMDVSSMRRDAVSHVSKDRTADHFGDFKHLVDIYLGGIDTSALVGVWAVTDSPMTYQDMETANKGLSVYIYDLSGTLRIAVEDHENDNYDTYIASDSTNYYLTIERSSTTLTCKIYSDASRETLIDTLTVTCETTPYRYIEGVHSRDSTGTPAAAGTYYIENLDLQEMVTPTESVKISREIQVK